MMVKQERRSAPQGLIDFKKIGASLYKHKLLWITPTILSAVFGVFYTLTKNDKWVASQALILRDEAVGEMGFSGGQTGPLGRFDSNDSLKRSLETLLQIAKHRKVVGAALEQVGPAKSPASWNFFASKKQESDFPSTKGIEDLQAKIAVTSPKGTEFGTSEVIYLSVSDKNSTRAVAMTGAVCDQLEKRMGDLRNEHAKSIIAELTQKTNLAERELHEATLQLSMLEQDLGGDLGEMRTLAEAGSAGESNLRSQVNQIKGELRQADAITEEQAELVSFLKQVGTKPEAIVAMPNRLLASQPSLSRMKDGLVDAQLRTAQLKGNLTNSHPRVQVAFLYEKNIEAQLRREVKSALISTQAEKAVARRLVDSLQNKLKLVQDRLDRLAAQRAGYVNMISKVSQRREQLRQASVSLAEARGRQEAARASSLLTRLDDPFAGSKPSGPGKKTLILGSLLGGLFFGLSLVYLIAPWQAGRAGRRASNDRGGRRTADGEARQPAAQPQPQFAYLPQGFPQAQPAGLAFFPLQPGSTPPPAAAEQAPLSLEHLAQIVESK